MHRTWVEISKSALIHNLRVFKRTAKTAKVMAVVKSNAYGHGLAETAKVLRDSGADWFGVDSLNEAVVLRKAGIKNQILIMGYVPLSDLASVSKIKASMVVYNLETLRRLASFGSKTNIHLKIETGVNRQGIPFSRLGEFLDLIKQNRKISLQGLNTHFADAEEDLEFTKKQIEILGQAKKQVESAGYKPMVHCSATAASLILPDSRNSMIRAGIGLYGLWPSFKSQKLAKKTKLMPALSWKTMIAHFKAVKKGETVGYGRAERLQRDSVVAVLPVGYWDGYDRKLGFAGRVWINNKPCKVLGRVCMNMIMIDATDAGRIELEQEAVLLGPENPAEEMAEKIGTINYEIITRINPQIPRIYLD